MEAEIDTIYRKEDFVKLLPEDDIDNMKLERGKPGDIGIVIGYSPITGRARIFFPFRPHFNYVYCVAPDRLLEPSTEEEFWNHWEDKIIKKLEKIKKYNETVPQAQEV